MHMEFPREDRATQLIRKIRISSIFALEDVDSGCCCKELFKYYLLIEYLRKGCMFMSGYDVNTANPGAKKSGNIEF